MIHHALIIMLSPYLASVLDPSMNGGVGVFEYPVVDGLEYLALLVQLVRVEGQED